MVLKVIEPAVQTSVQGEPFRGYHIQGMPHAGPADALSHALANWLAGNPPSAAALEISLPPARFEARAPCLAGFAGAPSELALNGRPIASHRSFKMAAGDILSIGAPKSGVRGYLAVHGGFAIEPVMGARSTYLPGGFGGFEGRALAGGDRLALSADAAATDMRVLPEEFRLFTGANHLLRATAGPEFNWLDAASRERLFGADFTVGRRSSRIGVRLEANRLDLADRRSLASGAVFAGTLQCPPDGAPFLLGADAQTTGGYPRAAIVARADRHLIGQLRPGDSVRLARIEPDAARRLYREKLALMRALIPEFRLD